MESNLLFVSMMLINILVAYYKEMEHCFSIFYMFSLLIGMSFNCLYPFFLV